jgi:hypothetical protein
MSNVIDVNLRICTLFDPSYHLKWVLDESFKIHWWNMQKSSKIFNETSKKTPVKKSVTSFGLLLD